MTLRTVTAAITASILAVAAGDASAKGGYVPKPAQPAPPCGVAGGGLPDPAETKACLARRYKPPEPKPNREQETPSAAAKPASTPAPEALL